MSVSSFIDKNIFRLNLLAALALLCTYPAPYFHPESAWLLALLGLGYPFALVINILFLVYWMVRRKIYLLFSLIVILTGWNLLEHSFGMNLFSNIPEATNSTVKIMSYNVQNFDLYNWTDNVESRNKMMELIHRESPDIVCFQEFYTEDGDKFENVEYLHETLKYPHYHFEKTLTLREKNHWGVAIFSRFPIVETQKLVFEDPKLNVAIYVDIVMYEDTIRIFNGHLQSIHLGKKDLKYVQDLKNQTDEKSQKTPQEHIKSSSSILRKLKNAYIKRGNQALVMAKAIEASPHKVLVCGDFNDTPSSYSYRTIANNLQDAFLESEFGFGGTYTGPLPSFRIDYILLSPELKVQKFKIIDETYSDHYPVSCVFSSDKW